MLVKLAVKLTLCLVLALPASALQPEHESITFSEFRPSLNYKSPSLIYTQYREQQSLFNQENLTYFFSAMLAMLILMAVRGQQKQDFSSVRIHHKPALPHHFRLHNFGHKIQKSLR